MSRYRAAVLLGIGTIAACSGSPTAADLVGDTPVASVVSEQVEETPTAPAVTDFPLVGPRIGDPEGPYRLLAVEPAAIHPVALAGETRSTSDMSSGNAGLWMATQATGADMSSRLVELDRDTGEVLQAIEIDEPGRVAVGGAAVWAESGNQIIRVDSQTNEQTIIDGSYPRVWHDFVWINQLAVATRISPMTSDVMATATVSVGDLRGAAPDAAWLEGVPDTDMLSPSGVVPGPDAAWAFMQVGPFDVVLVELDPQSGTVRHLTNISAGLDGFQPGRELIPVHGGVWFIGGSTQGAGLFFVETSEAQLAARIDLGDIEIHAPMAADEGFVYLLPSEGPLIVVDVDTRTVVERVDYELFSDEAYALTLTDEAVWIASRDGVLEFRAGS